MLLILIFRYYLEYSVMSTRNVINPGLGFRPQIDVEDMMIAFSTNKSSISLYQQFEKLNRSLGIFLRNKYDLNPDENEIDNCRFNNLREIRQQFKLNHSYCKFDYKKVLLSSECKPEHDFGYTNGPCVALKLNRIYNWIPEAFSSENQLPIEIKNILDRLNNRKTLINENIFIKCDGEFSADVDLLRHANISYHSAQAGVQDIGLLPIFYYPFLNQPGYKSPLVFVHFRNLPKHTLLNVLCKGYAQNIDSGDKVNLRGMTRFQIYYGN
jgi:sodium/potassium-transporting ATPase subunit beta